MPPTPTVKNSPRLARRALPLATQHSGTWQPPRGHGPRLAVMGGTARPLPAPPAPSCIGALVLPRLCQAHLWSLRQPSSRLAIPLAPFGLAPLPRHPPHGSCPSPTLQAGPGQGSPPSCSPFHPRHRRSTSWPFRNHTVSPALSPRPPAATATHHRALPVGRQLPPSCWTHRAPEHPRARSIP